MPIIAAVHLVVAERVRSLVEGSSSDPKVTVSVGVATHRGGRTTTEALVALADRAAYRAKSAAGTLSPCRARETLSTRPNAFLYNASR